MPEKTASGDESHKAPASASAYADVPLGTTHQHTAMVAKRVPPVGPHDFQERKIDAAARDALEPISGRYDMEDFRRREVATSSPAEVPEPARVVGSNALATEWKAAPDPDPVPAPPKSSAETGALSPAMAWLQSVAMEIRTDRRLQIVAVAVVVLVVGIVSLATRGASISGLRKNAASIDGKMVTVKGRVGEVFQMGSSYAFYLHQGRDTIVVFTRTRTPVPSQNVSVVGSVSTGYLEGVPRLALFEDETRANR